MELLHSHPNHPEPRAAGAGNLKYLLAVALLDRHVGPDQPRTERVQHTHSTGRVPSWPPERDLRRTIIDTVAEVEHNHLGPDRSLATR